MLIAVTSTNGTDVDQHFGHTESFSIYSYNNCNPELIKEIAVEKYSVDDPNHPFDLPRFATVANQLIDCKVLVTKKIGDKPKQELTKLGITTVISSETIPAALKVAHDAICVGDCDEGKKINSCSCSSPKEVKPITF